MGKEVSEDLYKQLGKKFIDNGATILGGCCETSLNMLLSYNIKIVFYLIRIF